MEINRVSTPDRVFGKINNEMPRPLAIIVFGPDAEITDNYLAKVSLRLSELQRYRYSDTPPGAGELKEVLKLYDALIVAAHEDYLRVDGFIESFISVLKTFGVKTVVGYYVRPEPFAQANFFLSHSAWKYNRYLRKLDQLTPKARLFDYMIIANGREI